MGEKLSKTLAQNKQALEAQFGGTVDLYMKDVQLCGISCCICMFEGLSSIERLWIMMLDSLSKPQVMPRDGKELLNFRGSVQISCLVIAFRNILDSG